jgi:hypothetical protein
MHPALQAVSDRYIMDVANVLYLVADLPPGANGRTVPATGWTIAQTVAHLGHTATAQAEAIARAGEGQPLEAPASVAPPALELPEAVASLNAGRAHMLEALRAVPDAFLRTGEPAVALVEQADDWSYHFTVHALEILEVLPELRMDLMLLNWLLSMDVSDDPAARARQVALFEDLQAESKRPRTRKK